MATESVKLIVGAQDRASAVLSGIGTAVEGVEDKIGGLAKQSAEGGFDVQSLLAQFAGDELTEFGSQLLTIKDKLADFNANNVKGAKGLGLVKAGLIAAAAVGGFKFGQWLIGANGLQEDFQAQLAKSRQLIDEVNDAQSRIASQQQFELSLIKDPEAQKAKIEALLETAQKNLRGTQNSAKSAQSQFDDMNTTFNSWTGNKILALTAENSEQAAEAAKKQKAAVADLQTQLNQFNQSEAVRIAEEREAAEKTRTDSIHEIVKALREQAKTIGMTSQELEIYKLKQLGANSIALEAAKTYQAQADAATKAAEATKAAADAAKQQATTDQSALDALQAQLIALEQGAEAAAQYRDAQSGMSAEAQAQAAALRDQIAAVKQRNDLEKDAKKIIEDNKTAQQKFFDEYKKQAKLAGKGLIDPETFAKSTKKLRDQLAADLKAEAGGNERTTGPIQANEDRFSIRGGGSDAGAKQLEAAKSANAILAKIDAKMQDNNERLQEIIAKEDRETEVIG